MKMKKQLYILGLCTIVISLSACKGNYDDWADPQNNPQEDAITIPGYTATAADNINLNNTGDSVKLYVISQTNLPQGYKVENNRVVLTPEGDGIKDELPAKINAGVNCKVDSAELQNVVANAFGKRPIARSFKAHVYSDVNVNGDDVWVDAGEITATITPAAPVLSTKGYYLVGNFQDWNANDTKYSYEFGSVDPYENPTITFKIPRPADSSKNLNFKILDLNAIGSWDAATVLTASVDKVILNDGTETGNLVDNTNGSGNNITIKATTDKYYEITINLIDQTISAKTINDPELFLTGSNYNWGATTNDWLSMTPVHTTDADPLIHEFWKIIYLHEGEQIKFAPQAGWGGDFAGDNINDGAGSGAVISGGNLKITTAGWYLLLADRSTKSISIMKPNLYLVGDASNGGWNVGTDADKFIVPTAENGEFISPAFAYNKSIRMCTLISGIDWWRSEFIVDAGTIVYRGNGGDPKSITATAGQKVYLNFNTNRGEYK